MSESKTARKVYPAEFKKTLALVKEQGYTVKEAAEAVGIQELLKLCRENKRLKTEQEILKKASAFRAKHIK